MSLSEISRLRNKRLTKLYNKQRRIEKIEEKIKQKEREEEIKKEKERNKDDDVKYCIINKIGKGKYADVFLANNYLFNTEKQETYIEFEKYIKNEINNYRRLGELKNRFLYFKEYNTKKTNQRCIIKMLKAERKDKFQREVSILKTLRHPNIVNLIDVIESDYSERKCLVFEFTSLFDTMILFENMDYKDIKIYAKQILEGLDFAHKHGIVHRDIKPENLVINPLTKSLKIIDWGISEYIELCDTTKIGTRGYKAPELIFDLPYDYKIDVWGFGIVFCEMIFGQQLFPSSNDFRSLICIIGKDGAKEFIEKYNIKEKISYLTIEPFLIDEVTDKIPREIIDGSLAYDKEKRYTCAELLATTYFTDPYYN